MDRIGGFGVGRWRWLLCTCVLAVGAAFVVALAFARAAGAAGTTTFTGTVHTGYGYAQSSGTVTVVDAATLAPLVSAPITSGSYTVATSATADVKLSFSGTGLATVWNGQRGTAATAAAITPSGSTMTVDAILDAPGTLEGTVRHGDAPLVHIWVLAMQSDLNVAVASTFTDAAGAYVLSVPVGAYRVRFVDPNNLADPNAGYHTEMYPGDETNTFTKGAIVDAHPYVAFTGIDAGLFAVPGCQASAFVGSANLSGRDLADCTMTGATLGLATLTGANLQNANLANAKLGYAGLKSVSAHRANFTGANLAYSRMNGADLHQANLTGAFLNYADLTGADLRGATLTGATLTGAKWGATVCPDGTSSDADGNTCAANLGGRTFTVDTTTDLVDPTPGDGVCGAPGSCSLRAAVMEANAEPYAVTIELAPGSMYSLTLSPGSLFLDTDGTGDLDLRGNITINGHGASIVNNVFGVHTIDVFASATVVLSHLELFPPGSNYTDPLHVGLVENHGTLRIDDSMLRGSSLFGVVNDGQLFVNRSFFTNDQGGVLNRAGTTAVLDATLDGSGSTRPMFDGAGGTLTVGNSIVMGSCSGAVTSNDYDTALDASCPFTKSHDRRNTPVPLRTVPTYGPATSLQPYTGSSVVDSGRPGCTGPDALGRSRPLDGDGDGVAVCDRGAVELGAYTPFTATVNTTATGADAAPGDGVCATTNPGECTLDAALQEAAALNGPDTINLPAGAALSSAPLAITAPLTLNGNGATIATGGLSVVTGLTAQLTDVSLLGSSSVGVTAAGTVQLTRSTVHGYATGAAVTGSFTATDSELSAGTTGISSTGSVTLTRSLVADYTTVGIAASKGVVNLRTSTVSSNGSAATPGSGLALTGVNATVYDSTIAGNTGSASVAGGIQASGGSVTLVNTIVAEQKAGADCASPVTSQDYNLSSDLSCGFGKTHDLAGVRPGLSPLVALGGSRRTQQLSEGSPALDTGRSLCPGLDMLGRTRALDGDGNGTKVCDRGAVEATARTSLTLDVNSTGDDVDANPGDGVCQTATSGECTLRAAVMEADATNGPDTINLQPGAVHPTDAETYGAPEGGPATGDLDLWSSGTLHGNGATIGWLQWWGPGAFRIENVTSPYVVVTGSNLTVDGSTLAQVHSTGLWSCTACVLPYLDEAGTATVTDSQVADASVVAGGFLTLRRVSITDAWASGRLDVDESTFVRTNYRALDVMAGGTATLTRTTIEGAAFDAYAMYTQMQTVVVEAAGSLSVTDSTIASDFYNGYAIDNAPGGTVTLRNSILDFAAATSPTCVGAITSLGYNLADDSSCGLTDPTDLPNTRASLAPLAARTGELPTREPSNGSPAIDSGAPGCSGADPRGVVLPQDGDGDTTAACDRGAVEARPLQAWSFSVGSTGTGDDANPGDGICETVNPGECTLAAAIDEMNVTAGTYTLDLAPGATYPAIDDLHLARAVTIHGHGATIAPHRWLLLHTAGAVSFDSLTIGDPSSGSIDAPAATVTFTNVNLAGSSQITSGKSMTITGASALYRLVSLGSLSVDGVSGDIETSGTTTVTHATALTLNVHAGTASVTRSGLVNVTTDGGNLAITNSTIQGAQTGRGLEIDGGTATVTDTTITKNRMNIGVTAGTLTLTNSIVGDPLLVSANCTGPVTSGGWNLVSDATCNLTGPSDVQAVPIALGPRRDDLTFTPVYVPLTGSPAIDSGKPGCSGTDQRGVARNTDGDGDAVAGCERGAVEVTPWNTLNLTVSSTADKVDANPGDGICQTSTPGECTLRAAIMEANESTGLDVVNLQPGTTYNLTIGGIGEGYAKVGDLDIATGLVLHGNGATVSGVTGFYKERAFDVPYRVSVSMDALTIVGWTSQQGAALQNGLGTVTLANCVLGALVNSNGTLTITDSSVDGVAGTGINNTGILNVVRSSVSGNGGIGIWGTTVRSKITLDTSTVSGNGNTGITASAGSVTITSSTIANNTGGGVNVTSTTTAVTNSIVANQASGSDCSGTITSGGYNLGSDTSCPFTGVGDARGVVVGLGVLGANGGPTRTQVPTAGSVAIDTGQPGCSGTDQRGVARPQGGACDKGAVEQ